MIIKKLLNRIKLNKYTYLLLFISLITGLFKEISIIFIILFFHELGHIFIAFLFNWKIKQIIFYPFGGLTIFDEIIDKPLYEEFIITIMGPIFQIIFFIIINILYKKYLITEYVFNIFLNYHYNILLFNLLPILPLDGAKLFNIIFNKLFNFRKSYSFSIYLSILILIFFIILHFKSSYIILISFLITEAINAYKNKNYIFNKFILEKKLYNNNYKKYKKINNYKKMYRNKKNIIKNNNIYLSEKSYLKKIDYYKY